MGYWKRDWVIRGYNKRSKKKKLKKRKIPGF